MIKQVTGTIIARVFTTLMNLLVIMLAGHALGADGLGTIALIVLGITLIVLAANIASGGALVYLVPRVPLGDLLKPAYAWAVICCALSIAVLHVVPLVPEGFELHVCVLAFIQSVYTAHLSVLLGQQRIKQINVITALQGLMLVVAFIVSKQVRGKADLMDYVIASYASFGLTFVLSTLSMRRQGTLIEEPQRNVLRFMFRQGILTQGANGLQLLNYRMAYWIIEKAVNSSALGIYSVANQLAESAWLAPKSLGSVLYSRVSNTKDPKEQMRLTLTILKTSMACATAVMIVLLVLPDHLFSLAFGEEIIGLRPIMLYLTIGILSMAASQAFSHYFSGTARNHHNLIGSGLGVLVTLVAGNLLIPPYHLHGAGLTATLAYSTNALYQMVMFMRASGASFSDLWPDRQDLDRLKQMIARYDFR